MKSPADTRIETYHPVMPQDANPHGNIFGGALLAWMDTASGLVAQRHAENLLVATASVERVDFLYPARVGEQLRIIAQMNYVGTKSMEIGVHVYTVDPVTGDEKLVAQGPFTYVSLDANSRTLPIPPLEAVTDEDRQRMEAARQRAEARKSQVMGPT